MVIPPYLPFFDFKAANPILNYSSRVYLLDQTRVVEPPDGTIYDLQVSDGVIVEVISDIVYDLWVSDAVLVTDTVVFYDLSVSNAVISDSNTGFPVILVQPESLTFPDTFLTGPDGPSELLFTIANTGTAPLTVTGISSTQAAFRIEPVTLPLTLAVDEDVSLVVTFTPVLEGTYTGFILIQSDGSVGSEGISLSGRGIPQAVAPLLVLSTLGNQIVDSVGAKVCLRSANWFGAEGTNYTPHGTWIRNYKSIIDQIASFGFNCIRLPLSGDIVTPGRMPLGIDVALNPDLAGLNALQVIDKILDHCLSKGIYVVLDHHRREAGVGADGSPVGGSYDLARWHATWTTLATRYKTHSAVVGADLHNEPHDLSWDVWAGYAEGCAGAINLVAPHWLVCVEGVGQFNGESYWWGGQLKGVLTRPVVIPQVSKLVYSPHEYGQSVASGQAWLDYEGSPPPANWPNNLYAKWMDVWGFIFYQGIAPIWIGEFGGKFGYDGTGTDHVTPHRDEERLWLSTLTLFMNGNKDGDSDSDIGTSGGAGGVGMSYAYWSYNPNSGDTGGLVLDNWVTPQTGKLTLLTNLLGGAVYVTVLIVDDDGETLLDDDGTELEYD